VNSNDLSSDGGLILLKEFFHKIGLEKLLKEHFKTNDSAVIRKHRDDKNLLQAIFQIISGNFEDDRADNLRTDPVFKVVLDKETLASQPTMSRFYNRMDNSTAEQLNELMQLLRKAIYTYQRPENVLLDLDSTLLETYGKQEGKAFNYHYQANGYHPLVCYDGLTGDLLKISLRDGAAYSSTGVTKFLEPLIDEFENNYSTVPLFLRGDSGFATPKLYEQCEKHDIRYVIRLKENNVLINKAQFLENTLREITNQNSLDYAVVYGEFDYQAGSWSKPRRVVCKIEKPKDQILFMYTFIVTNTELPIKDVIKLYCNRGKMENFIKECKNGFDFSAVSSSSKTVNENRLQIHALAYNLFNWFRRLVLPKTFRKQTIETLRTNLLKIAVRAVCSARYIQLKFCSYFSYQNEFYQILLNIDNLNFQLE